MEPERLQIVDIVNKIFGESGWSFSISNVAVDYIDDSRSGNYSAGASAVVRVQRTNGVFREDIGFGSNWGSNKADVISKAKKDAVTDGLKGAVINFGGDMARQVNTVTPRKSMTDSSRHSSSLRRANSSVQPNEEHNARASPPQAAVKPNPVSRSLGEKTVTNMPICGQVTTATPHPKSVPAQVVPTKQTPLPPSSPLAVPLPQQPKAPAVPLPQQPKAPAVPLPHQQPKAPSVPKNTVSEEELAKIERKKRQKQLQDEFRKKHQSEKAQAQSKPQDECQQSKGQQPSREPLKEQQIQPSTSSRNGPSGLLDADDEVMLSTQDMEAISAIAANNTNISRHSPMLSSPSIIRNAGLDAPRPLSIKPAGSKRPDLSSFAFNSEKRQRSESRY